MSLFHCDILIYSSTVRDAETLYIKYIHNLHQCVCRYIAVCEPLRYHAIMTSARLYTCCVLAWSVALLCIGVLFTLHMNVPLCGNTIQHVYCSNRAIMNLACRSTPSNNIYGQCTGVEQRVESVTTADFICFALS